MMLEAGKEQPNAKKLLKAFTAKAAAVPLKQKFIIAFLIFLVIAGNAMNIIGLNFWLKHFRGHKTGVFTTLIVSGLIFTLFFAVALVIYIIRHRPHLKWALSRRAIWTLFWIGFWDGTNSWLTIYATNDTPEVLQAIFLSIAPMFTLIFTKLILKDPRNYVNRWVLGSFGLMLGSVALASFPDFANTKSITPNAKWWSLLFFLAVPQLSIYNVYQTQYMRDFTCVEEDCHAACCDNYGDDTCNCERPLLVGQNKMVVGARRSDSKTESEALRKAASEYGSTATAPNPHSAATRASLCSNNSITFHAPGSLKSAHVFGFTGGDDSTVKLVMLFGDTFIQLLLCLFLLPADALPWFGGSQTVGSAAENLLDGLQCLFTCEWNFLFCLIYSMGYVFTYVGCAYLNHYSATLSALITQLSSPMTAVILIIFPILNATEGAAPWYLSVLAVVIMVVGTLVYTVWEEMTAPLGEDGGERSVDGKNDNLVVNSETV